MIFPGMNTSKIPPSCPECHTVLIKNANEPSQSMCPICGYIPDEEEIQKMESEQNKPELIPKVNPVSKPIIIQGKSRRKRVKKRMYDEFGNEINQQDIDIMNDLARGRKVLYYNESVPKTSNNSK